MVKNFDTGETILEGDALTKAIEEDRARSAGGDVDMEAAQQQQFAEAATQNRKAQERNKSLTIGNNAFDRYGAEAGAGMKQLADLGYIDNMGRVSEEGLANGITQESIQNLLQTAG